MSRFKTTIPINLGEVINKLPARSYVESVEISADRKSAEVVWGCDDLKTGFTFPVEMPVEKIGELKAAAATSRLFTSPRTTKFNARATFGEARIGMKRRVLGSKSLGQTLSLQETMGQASQPTAAWSMTQARSSTSGQQRIRRAPISCGMRSSITAMAAGLSPAVECQRAKL